MKFLEKESFDPNKCQQDLIDINFLPTIKEKSVMPVLRNLRAKK